MLEGDDPLEDYQATLRQSWPAMTSHLSQNSVPHHEGLGKEPKESDASYFW